MKIAYPNRGNAVLPAVVITALLCWRPVVCAQLPVKGVYATRYKATSGSTYNDGVSAGSGITAGTYVYKYGTQTVTSNNFQRLDTFTVANTYNGTPGAGTSVFIFSNTAVPVVKFRRVNNANVTGRRKSIWFESDGNNPTPGTTGTPVALRPAYNDSLEDLFGKRLFNVGVDNAFENGTVTNNNNIERIDVIFPGGLKAFNPDSAGFTVFDRGAAGGNDSFMIAAIKSLDANGDPADYYPAIRVGPANYGAASGTTLNFHGLRKDDAEPDLRLFIAAGNQAREGVYFSFRSLGFPYSSGTSPNALYGYSVMATDVNRAAPGTPKNMVYYTNATIFPTNTELGSVGGIDMVAVTGVATTLATASGLLLPVTVEGFTATAGGDKVMLGWRLTPAGTPGEISIERSADGVLFTGFASPGWPVTDDWQYVTDWRPLTGENYYRLKTTDKSGAIAYSPVQKVRISAAPAAAISLSAYPMPVVNRQCTLVTSGLPAGPCRIEITNMNGTRVYRQTVNGSRLIRLQLPAQLPAGVYGLRLCYADGTTWQATPLLLNE